MFTTSRSLHRCNLYVVIIINLHFFFFFFSRDFYFFHISPHATVFELCVWNNLHFVRCTVFIFVVQV